MAVIAGLAPLAIVACGGGGNHAAPSPSGEDLVIREITGLAELAVNAYASSGPGALHDYLTPEIAQRCSAEALARALDGQRTPGGFRRLEDVRIERHVVTASVVHGFNGEEQAVEWQFVSVSLTGSKDDVSWRIGNVPGLERCLH